MFWSVGKTSSVLAALFYFSVVYAEKYKLCVVDGRGGFKKSGRYCPTLDKPDSKVECVLGIDRLDCLRRISKGKVDFSVFTPEDLVTATNSEIEVLITNELRYTKDRFEYEIVAVFRDSSNIKSRHDLKDKKFCHPGYGYETDWTRILSNYLEASVVPQKCQTQYTLTENRIKASSEFFKSACKAGAWVNNLDLDATLKQKYPNLCANCDNPSKCTTQDKYWGRRGPLYCLTDGSGEISWARLDDVRVHFGLTPGGAETTAEGYSFLCPDDTIRPLNSTTPCVWAVKPWPVIATKRTSAQDVQEIVSNLDLADSFSWQNALRNLIQTYHLSITKLEPVVAIETYLANAHGFLNANSFTGCHPPRTIRVCTTSILENAKCAWLRESAAVYGIEPDLDCLKADNTTHCMQALADDIADIVMVPPDLVHTAKRDHNLTTLFYETVNDNYKYLTVAVTKNNSDAHNLSDLKGRKACFPAHDGVAWNSVIQALQEKNLLNDCPLNRAVGQYFGPTCVPRLPENQTLNFKSSCNGAGDQYSGDFGAIRCLLDGKGDVAFISQNSLVEFIHDPIENKNGKIDLKNFKILCPSEFKGCHLSWSPVGFAMVRSNSTGLWIKDTLDVFLQLDGLFGKKYKSLTSPLQIFAPFDGKSNVLFHDNTERLKNVPTARVTDTMPRQYEDVLRNIKECQSSSCVFKAMPVLICFLILSKVFF